MLSKSFKFSFSRRADSPATSLPSSYIIPSSELIFNSGNKIGQGASGAVFAGIHKGKPVAVKQFFFDNPENPQNKELILKEASELLALQHDNIVKCYGVCLEISSLILELTKRDIWIDGTQSFVHSLRQLIELIGDLPDDTKHEALFQISCGLSFLHSKKIIHGDLKSANVLVTGSGDDIFFKLGDFGSAHALLTSKLSTANMTARMLPSSRNGTTPFEAPEVFVTFKKTTKSDIYSFAMIMYELQHPTLSHPWESVFGNQVRVDTLSALIMEAVKKGERPPVNGESPFTSLMRKCWDSSPESRPDAFDLNKQIVLLHEVNIFLVFMS